MYVDKENMFSQAQAVTAAAGSTHTINQGVVGGLNLGVGGDLYIVVVVTTALTDGGSNTSTVVALEGDSTTSFSPDATRDLFSFAQAAAAGTMKFARFQPDGGPEALQYLRLKYTPAGADLTGGAFSAFLTHDIQAAKNYAKGYTISG